MAEPYQPTLTTSVVGSHTHPGWLDLAVAAAERGELGPKDIREFQDDAVDTAIRDQEDAGVDVISEGEMRRVGFFTAEFYRHLTGVAPLEPARRLGPAGHDQQHRFEVLEAIEAPQGLGVVEEFEYARTRTARPIKVTIPGPFTLSGRLALRPGRGLRRSHRRRTRVRAHPGRGVRGPGRGRRDLHPDRRALASHPPGSLRRVRGALQRRCRRGAGSGHARGASLLRQLLRPAAISAALPAGAGAGPGLRGQRVRARVRQPRDGRAVDVAADDRGCRTPPLGRRHRRQELLLETPDDVAWRIDRLLGWRAGGQLSIVPDCGFSQTARWAVKPKLAAMVAGRESRARPGVSRAPMTKGRPRKSEQDRPGERGVRRRVLVAVLRRTAEDERGGWRVRAPVGADVPSMEVCRQGAGTAHDEGPARRTGPLPCCDA